VKNRRLLIILIVFICIGTLAVLGSTLFALRTVNVTFSSYFSFLRDMETGEVLRVEDVQASLKNSIWQDVKHKNTLFGINDNKVRDTIESANTRVRVTNIERKFPNRLEITVRERYPVYKMQFGDKTVVICGYLRVIEHLDAVEFEKYLEKADGWPLIVIPTEIGAGLTLADLPVGVFLTDMITEGPHIAILKQIVPHLSRIDTFEDTICHVFESISFGGTAENLRLVMTSRSEPDAYLKNNFRFIIWEAESPRLTDMLTRAWQAVNLNPDDSGDYNVWLQDEYPLDHGEVIWVPDGIFIGFKKFTV